jgi:3-deoxy-7-phosphoheptulonate synthase
MVLHGADDRLVVVVGPCSIHDYDAAMEYARRCRSEAARFADDLLILMRVYFEKPRTTVGWKGLINDPRMDGSFRINEGLRLARKLLWEINELGLPCGTEFLDTITPQYTADLISLGRHRRAHHRIAGASRTGLGACPARSASRTAPTATSASPSMRSRRRPARTISSR